MASERFIKVKQVTDPKRIAWAAGLHDCDPERYLDVPWAKSDPDVLAIRGGSQRSAYISGRGVGFRAAFGGRRPSEDSYKAIWANQRAWFVGVRAGEWLAHHSPLPKSRRPAPEVRE